nr:PREDICTED: uncharacterized protein LOC106704495 [Latimeria chalumnae]|eukprot:XP_014347133.1 PREDICTED: uncharacterized protein LOC106704495 [Latimeria chalumnae]
MEPEDNIDRPLPGGATALASDVESDQGPLDSSSQDADTAVRFGEDVPTTEDEDNSSMTVDEANRMSIDSAEQFNTADHLGEDVPTTEDEDHSSMIADEAHMMKSDSSTGHFLKTTVDLLESGECSNCLSSSHDGLYSDCQNHSHGEDLQEFPSSGQENVLPSSSMELPSCDPGRGEEHPSCAPLGNQSLSFQESGSNQLAANIGTDHYVIQSSVEEAGTVSTSAETSLELFSKNRNFPDSGTSDMDKNLNVSNSIGDEEKVGQNVETDSIVHNKHYNHARRKHSSSNHTNQAADTSNCQSEQNASLKKIKLDHSLAISSSDGQDFEECTHKCLEENKLPSDVCDREFNSKNGIQDDARDLSLGHLDTGRSGPTPLHMDTIHLIDQAFQTGCTDDENYHSTELSYLNNTIENQDVSDDSQSLESEHTAEEHHAVRTPSPSIFEEQQISSQETDEEKVEPSPSFIVEPTSNSPTIFEEDVGSDSGKEELYPDITAELKRFSSLSIAGEDQTPSSPSAIGEQQCSSPAIIEGEEVFTASAHEDPRCSPILMEEDHMTFSSDSIDQQSSHTTITTDEQTLSPPTILEDKQPENFVSCLPSSIIAPEDLTSLPLVIIPEESDSPPGVIGEKLDSSSSLASEELAKEPSISHYLKNIGYVPINRDLEMHMTHDKRLRMHHIIEGSIVSVVHDLGDFPTETGMYIENQIYEMDPIVQHLGQEVLISHSLPSSPSKQDDEVEIFWNSGPQKHLCIPCNASNVAPQEADLPILGNTVQANYPEKQVQCGVEFVDQVSEAPGEARRDDVGGTAARCRQNTNYHFHTRRAAERATSSSWKPYDSIL